MSVRPHPTKARKEPGLHWQIDVGRGKDRKRIAFTGTRRAAEVFELQVKCGHFCDSANGKEGMLQDMSPFVKKGEAVYFIQQGVNGPIKIGYTVKSIRGRMVSLQVGNPNALRLVGFIMGADTATESEIHYNFKQYRIGGEWFLPAPELIDYIKQVSLSRKVQKIQEFYKRLSRLVGNDPLVSIFQVVELLESENTEELTRLLS